VNGEPFRLEVNVFPSQMKELTASKPRVHGQEHDGVQVIDVRLSAVRQQ
jgi:hypothetical protein